MKVIKNEVQLDERHVHCTACDKKMYAGVPVYKIIANTDEITCKADDLCRECLEELYAIIGKTLKERVNE